MITGMESKASPSREGSSLSPGRRKLLRWGVIGAAVLVALIAWLTTRGGGSTDSEPAPAGAPTPRIVSEAELKEAAVTLGQPIFWAGPQPGKELELTELGEGGGAQVVYLPEGMAAGEGTGRELTIGSYPLADPKAAVEGYAKRPGSETVQGDGGTVVAISEATPTSAYFAAPDNSVQVEVYDPSSKRALTLAVSGAVKPVG